MKPTRQTKKIRKRIFSALTAVFLALAMFGSLVCTAAASQTALVQTNDTSRIWLWVIIIIIVVVIIILLLALLRVRRRNNRK